MIFFKNKRINAEIAASTELYNDEVVENICETLTVTKNAIPEDDACTTKIVDVELKVVFAQALGLVTIIDNVSNVFVDSIIESSVTADPNNNGTISVSQNPLEVTWSDLDVDEPMTATLRFKVLVKDNAIENNNAFVNNNIQVNADEGRNCTFPHLNGAFFIPRCPESPVVTSLLKDNDKNEYDCDETIHSTLTLKLDKGDTNVVVIDDLSNSNVGTPTNIVASNGTTIVDANNNIVWTVGTVTADTEITLEYDITPDQIKTNNGFVTSEVRVDGDLIDPEIVIPRNTENPNYIFLDTFVRDCPEEDGECCCQACEPITVEPCELSKNVTVDVERIKCTGKLIDVTVNLQRVCPGQVLNVGVFLVENVPGDADGDGDIEEGETIQESRGFIVKQVTIPASDTACTSRLVNGFCFPLTDDTGCDADDRTFTAKVFATYINRTVPNCDCDTEPTQEA